MNPPPQDPALSPGTVVGGRYRIIQPVAEGPLDQLYEAQDVQLHVRVVLRVMRGGGRGEQSARRHFEQQARSLRPDGEVSGLSVQEVSSDAEVGPFAAVLNRDNRPLPEVLAQLEGVDGYAPPPSHPPASSEGFRFPTRESQVELEPLDPPNEAPAHTREEPRFARPKRPKRLETLELDTPYISRDTGPRPAAPVQRQPAPWGRLARLGGVGLVVCIAAAAALHYAQQRRASQQTTAEEPEAADPKAMAPTREVQIRFQVTPKKARLRVDGRLAPGHEVRVPASEDAFEVTLEAPGFLSQTVKVVPNRNRTVQIVLNRSGAKP